MDFMWLGFDVVYVCIVARNNIVVVENVDDFDDKFTCDVSVNLGYQYFGCRKHSSIMWWWSLKNDKLHLANIKVQVQKWITHNMNSIGWGLFVVNHNFIICEHTYTKMYHLKFLANN